MRPIMLFAHSKNGEGVLHALEDHLKSVANLAKTFSSKFRAAELGFWLGTWHDLGKGSKEFQSYLENPSRENRCDHKTLGSYLSAKYDQLIPFAILGHHSGLPDPNSVKDAVKKLSVERSQVFEDLTSEIADKLNVSILPDSDQSLIPNWLASENEELAAEFFIRMIFSALVDADFLDTEKHFNPSKTLGRTGYASIPNLLKTFRTNQDSLSGRHGDKLNEIRHEVYCKCADASNCAPGIFRLTVPTGGGKTRSSLAFALSHAAKHGLDRIIYSIPYTSIIEQTSNVFRSIFGDSQIVEHHSAVVIDEDEDSESTGVNRARLATENWDAPIVLTTTVQLFESLFASKPSRCRKLHNISNSIIVLDEAQLTPVGYLEPILDVLNRLVRNYGCTVILCTATQPAFNYSKYIQGFDSVTDIIPDSKQYFKALKRTDFEIADEPRTWEEISEEMRRNDQVLAIVNTKRDALALLNALDDDDAFHLSTLLCGAHRRDVLAEIGDRLKEGRPCRVVSTQVVEAGVDLDFPAVLRAIGPLDSIVQAAGRCNREGKLASGKVIIFKPKEGGHPPGEYATAISTAQAYMQTDDFDFHNPDCYEEYFRRFYGNVNTDKRDINAARRRLDFPHVNDRFRIIDDNTVAVIVGYDSGKHTNIIDSLIEQGANRAIQLDRDYFRKLQPYLVNIRRKDFDSLNERGFIKVLRDNLYLWLGAYDGMLGLVEAFDPSNLTV